LPRERFAASRQAEESATVRADDMAEQELLNRLAAIKAAAEILDDNDDLPASDRRLFLLVIQTEATRLHQLITG
jgi:signal transduction histidine kinase